MRSLRNTSRRRLAIETLECRLVLSGSQIDGTTWYHEPDGNPYAVISFDDLGPSAATQSPHVDRLGAESAGEASFGGSPAGNSKPVFHGVEGQVFADLDETAFLTINSLPSSIGNGWQAPRADLLAPSWVGGIWSAGLNPLLGEIDVIFAAGSRPKSDGVASGVFDLLRDGLLDSHVTTNGVNQSNGLPGDFRSELFVTRLTDGYFEIQFEGATGNSRVATFNVGSDSTAEMAFLSSTSVTSTEDAVSSKTVSEGGSIPLEAIVANVGSGDVAADDGAAIVEWIPKRGESFSTAATADVELIGELARAVAFETIDGEPAPLVYAASESRGGYAVTGEYAIAASGHLMAFPRHELFAGALGESADDVASRSAANRVELPLAQTAAWFLAALPWTSDDADLPGDAVADAGRAEAFSRFGEADVVEERLEVAGRSRVWLAAMPVLAVLAAERIVASKKKRERDAERPAR